MRDGREATVDEVMAEIEKYRAFITTAGGGVTLTGGEPLLQSAFTGESCAAARRPACTPPSTPPASSAPAPPTNSSPTPTWYSSTSSPSTSTPTGN
jgi:hypothetical protein